MAWHAQLALDYRLESGRTLAQFAHQGPLRVLQSLYPEGPAVCHNVLVHPPGGLVGGDRLELTATLQSGTHALITTPGAGRFYRSAGETAVQQVRLSLEAGARCEWLPLEAIYHSGCQAENRLLMQLAPGAELLGWDIAALGLPASRQPGFAHGSVLQQLELQGAWLERGRIDATDARLMDGPLGLAGHHCMASLFLAAGQAFSRARRDLALDLARAAIEASPLQATCGATAAAPQVVVVRVLAPWVEPVMALLHDIRSRWRLALWDLPALRPRSWGA